jgi:hypothetical protein
MTLSLRRKLPTTAHGRNTWAQTALEVQVRSEKPETRKSQIAALSSFLISGFSILVFSAGSLLAQENSKTDANGWAPPAVPKKLSSLPSRSQTGVWEQVGAETPKPPSSLYVNPTTGSVVPLPPPPPSVPSDEWKPTAAASAPASAIVHTSLQQPPPKPIGVGDVRAPSEEGEVQIQLEPPGSDRIFGRRDSETSLKIRIQQEVRQQKRQPIPFPDEPILSTQRYVARVFPPMAETVEPNYVCYGRLLFEDKNSERYGWDLGFIQPFVSAGIFFWDVAWLPYHLGTDPCRKYECNTGYCLPGDPVPYLIYPPTYSVTGAMAEIGTIVALAWIFPG